MMILKDIWDKLRIGDHFIVDSKSYWGDVSYYGIKSDSDSFIIYQNELGRSYSATYQLSKQSSVQKLLIDDYYSSIEEFDLKLKELIK